MTRDIIFSDAVSAAFEVPSRYSSDMNANSLLKHNINTLLRSRGQTRAELALWCRKSRSWLDKIMSENRREVPVVLLDRVADFFGLATYQLFQPGINPLSERRSGKERRSGFDRRVSHAHELHRDAPSMALLSERMRALTPDAYRRFARRVEAALTLAEPPTSTAAPPARPPLSAEPPEKPMPRSPHIHRVRHRPK